MSEGKKTGASAPPEQHPTVAELRAAILRDLGSALMGLRALRRFCESTHRGWLAEACKHREMAIATEGEQFERETNPLATPEAL
jgi:hypothetical protein